ncbi:tyramine/octopamine receptor-like [Dendronephthya gigantea]|uniref:tyramine/octopamine receptor-like n=1 Tax=Dendronephthya gigantea TaxID=151771 RepID=UPI00106B6C68|nr:tyramine/octopamine receptor-like [Dendronephthya gigantea]XP_028407471.1 tyramine/octopamine receptor-like [Dendronephthya gigantea]
MMEWSDNITVSYLTNPTERWTGSDKLNSIDFLKRLRLSRMISLILIAIFTVLGNALVLIVTWKEKRLHQPNKYFIALLSVADLLVGLFLAPFFAYQFDLGYTSSDRDNMSIHLCRFMVWMDVFALTTSIYSLTFISFDRYLKISKPLLYKSRMTTSRSIKIIFAIVLISTVFATYSATPYSGSTGILATGSGLCTWTLGFMIKSPIFYLFLTISTFFSPAVIIIIMYARIFHVVHKRNKMLMNGKLGETIDNQNQRTALLRDMKVIRMLLVVVGVFLLCWGPLFTWILIYFYHKNQRIIFSRIKYGTHVFLNIAETLPLFNSLCNPIIYVCLDQTYREAFKKLFRRMMRRPDARRQPPIA